MSAITRRSNADGFTGVEHARLIGVTEFLPLSDPILFPAAQKQLQQCFYSVSKASRACT